MSLRTKMFTCFIRNVWSVFLSCVSDARGIFYEFTRTWPAGRGWIDGGWATSRWYPLVPLPPLLGTTWH